MKKDVFTNSNAFRLRQKGVILSSTTVFNEIETGDIVATISNHQNGDWTYTLTNNAGNRFSIVGTNLVIGSVPPEFSNNYTIEITSTDGIRIVRSIFTISVEGAPSGFIFLTDDDGAYLTDSDGAYLMESI